MTQPFDDNDVLLRFVLTEEEKHPNQECWWNRATEYVLVYHPFHEMHYYYALCDGKWEEGHSFCKDIIVRLLHERSDAIAKEKDLRQKVIQHHEDICQTLGQALGYPRYCDDQANFPGSTAADGVCVGDEVAETLAEQAAERITTYRTALDAIASKWAQPARDVARAALRQGKQIREGEKA